MTKEVGSYQLQRCVTAIQSNSLIHMGANCLLHFSGILVQWLVRLKDTRPTTAVTNCVNSEDDALFAQATKSHASASCLTAAACRAYARARSKSRRSRARYDAARSRFSTSCKSRQRLDTRVAQWPQQQYSLRRRSKRLTYEQAVASIMLRGCEVGCCGGGCGTGPGRSMGRCTVYKKDEKQGKRINEVSVVFDWLWRVRGWRPHTRTALLPYPSRLAPRLSCSSSWPALRVGTHVVAHPRARRKARR